jgi:hypothetical protein
VQQPREQPSEEQQQWEQPSEEQQQWEQPSEEQQQWEQPSEEQQQWEQLQGSMIHRSTLLFMPFTFLAETSYVTI